MSTQHTIIIGGGIVGVSCAYYLARSGQNVTLIEREGLDEGCSTVNAGIIAVGHPPLPRPGLVKQTLRMLFDPANPLYVPPRFDPELFKWLWNFRKACSEEQFAHSMDALAELGWITGECYDQIVEDEKLDCNYHRTGWIETFITEERFQQGREEAQLLKEYGYKTVELNGDALRDREPAFLDQVLGGIHYTDSRFADPKRTVVEIADRAERHGATLRIGDGVRSILTEGDRAVGVELEDGERIEGDSIVFAAGIWSSALAQQIGMPIPMQPAKGYHVDLTPPEPCVQTACVLAETFVAVNPACDGLRLAGTLEFSGINHRMVERRVMMLQKNATKYFRNVGESEVRRAWCGLRPCTADGLPVIGWAPTVENAFIATGHAMMGYALGPGTGKLASEAIQGEVTSMDLSPFSPERLMRGGMSTAQRVTRVPVES